MKILLSAPLHLKTVPMGRYCAEVLRQMGHEVRVVNSLGGWADIAADKLFSKRKRFANAYTRGEIERFAPELFLAVFGFDVDRQTLDFLRAKKIVCACWWLNDPFQLQRSLGNAAHYDFYFTNAIGSVEDYRAAGVKNAFFLPTACMPQVHARVPAADKYRCDVCFAGDWSPLREQLMLSLYKDCDLKIFGPWRKKLPKDSPLHKHLTNGFFTPAEQTRMFASAKIIINLHTWYGKWDHGTNPRLYEAASSGAFQLVDIKREIPELFDIETQIATYRTVDEVPALVKKYLADGALRQKMAVEAQKRAHAQHTYRHRMEELLARVF